MSEDSSRRTDGETFPLLRHPVCGAPKEVEFSLMAWAPPERDTTHEERKTSPFLSYSFLKRQRNKSPYRRTYSKRDRKAEWQRNKVLATSEDCFGGNVNYDFVRSTARPG